MNLRYIGSKARLRDELASFIGPPDGGRFVDAFCGMGSVAAQAASLGWPVYANDHLAYAAVVTAARLTCRAQVLFAALGGYEAAVSALEELPGREGFMWREYSPASREMSAERIERRYFTEENAARIDAVRAQIGEWENGGDICTVEAQLLIADLISATNRVANIAGTYGCFLAKWSAQSQQSLELRARELSTQRVPFEVSVGDVTNVGSRPEDTLYLDPPYTKRQYASYYHILETIVRADEPVVSGIAGLRPWQHIASDYCYKRKALGALTSLVRDQAAQRVLLSYSSEGHVAIDDLCTSLEQMGNVGKFGLADIGRYRPNQVARDRASSVTEYLIVIDKRDQQSHRANAR